jgi:hypothetical protein
MPELKKLCNFEVFNVPEDDYREFERIAKRYRGNSFAPALREMITRYYLFEELAGLRADFDELKSQVAALQPKTKTVKTFAGGRLHGKVRQDEGEAEEG